MPTENDDAVFRDCLDGLRHDDFSRLEPLFTDAPRIIRWHREGDPSAGNATGMDALHWTANRGQLESVQLLLRSNAPLETRSMYGATVLGTAVWSAIHEPRPNRHKIIEDLIAAGAKAAEVPYPTGDEGIDQLLQRSDGANPLP